MKKILVIGFSQTGQLDEIIDRFLIPFKEVDIDRVKVLPQEKYPFPWTSETFFHQMPESVLEEETKINSFLLKHEDYDLIVFGYQPWFLSPSIPATSILKHEAFQKIINGKPVVTIIGARNMWLNAQESVKKQISDAGGNLVANIPLIDRNSNLISAITILYWMMKGKRDKMYGIFPKPGVSDEDIQETNLFGNIVFEALLLNSYDKLQTEIFNLNKINISTNILFIELRAKKLFLIWAKIIKKKGSTTQKRIFWLRVFKYYLLVALFLISPIVLIIYNLLIRPFQSGYIQRKKDYFYGLNPERKNV